MKTQISTKGKEAKEEKNKSQEAKERDMNKEVIISVYVESPSKPPIRDNDDAKRSNKSRPFFFFFSKSSRAATTRGYDRRAQLLAYAQELRRNPDTKLSMPKKNSKPRPKMSLKKVSNPVRIKFAKSRKRDHQLVPEVDISCQPKSLLLRKKDFDSKKKDRPVDFQFVGKLRGLMTGFCRE